VKREGGGHICVNVTIIQRGWEGVDWIRLAQDRYKWLALVNVVIDIWAILERG
jgi:hypothetical protein